MSTSTFDHTVKSRESFFKINFKELWHARDMLICLVLRDFKIRFKQSYLGIAWALIQPLGTTLVFTLILSKALKVEFDGPYPLFFLSGLIAWNYFSKVFGNGTLAIVNESELIRKVYFPRLILPLYQAMSVLTDFAIALLIYFVLGLIYGRLPGWEIVYLPLFLLLCMIYGTAISLWLGPINVRFRDIQIILPLFTQLMFILTPVMYPSRQISDSSSMASHIYNLNPMVGIVEGFRLSLLGTGNPFQTTHLISYAFIILLFLSGIVFYNASQKHFADVI